MKRKAFTIVELLLGISLLTVLLVVSGVVFQMAVKSYRTAAATGEVARKLRAVTNQLNTDFRGLRKDGQIFIAWVAEPDPEDPGFAGYKRFDQITFFADGNFNSYNYDNKETRVQILKLLYAYRAYSGRHHLPAAYHQPHQGNLS